MKLSLIVPLFTLVALGCDDGGETTAVDKSPRVEVQNQDISAGSVLIDGAYAPAASWVVLHRSDSAGVPVLTRSVGEAALNAGFQTSIQVPITGSIADGHVLVATIHQDLGKAGTFEPLIDLPLKIDGQVIQTAFLATVGARPAASVLVFDQLIARNAVLIDEVTAEKAGFLVLYRSTDEGALDTERLAGQIAVTKGTSARIPIRVTAKLNDTERLFARLVVDSDQNGTFQPAQDKPARIGDVVVQASFQVRINASSQPSVSADDQLVAANQVKIARVVSAVEGWIVLHRQNADGTPVTPAGIGRAQVRAGVNEAVNVTLSDYVTDGEAVFAMLHFDRGQAGAYEFPDGPDIAVTLDSVAVGAGFTVEVETESQPRVLVGDQHIEENEVQIDAVSALTAGYLVLHRRDQDGSFSRATNSGWISVPAGLSEDLTITLTRYVGDGAQIVATLYTDRGEAESFEVPEPDSPATIGGKAVQTGFVVTTDDESQPRLTTIDQTIASNRVMVKSATALAPGFIVVHRLRADGTLILDSNVGQAPIAAGFHTDVSITLTDYIADRALLAARLYRDAGEFGRFEPALDPAVMMGTTAVRSIFQVRVQVTSQARVWAFNQTAEVGQERRVTIGRVNSFAAGWIVLRRSDAGGNPVSPGNVGFAQIPAGLSTDVRIILTDDIEDGQTLHAALHFDRGEAGVYQFPGVDEPVLLGGRPISDPFVVSLP